MLSLVPMFSSHAAGSRLVGLPRSFGTLTGLAKLYINNNPELERVFSPDQIKQCGYDSDAVQLVVRLCGAAEPGASEGTRSTGSET